MATDKLNPCATLSQPLKKRKVVADDTSDHSLNCNDRMSEKTNTNTQCSSEQDEEGFSQNSVKSTQRKKRLLDETGSTSDTDANSEKHTSKTNGDNNNEVPNVSQTSLIGIRKMEELCATPKKPAELDTLLHVTDIKAENVCSPRLFSPSTLNTSSMEWEPHTIKVIQETPESSKDRKYFRTKSITPIKLEKRKVSSDINDYDRFSDTLKSELHEPTGDLMEPIDMLHDLNSVIDFEDVKIHTDFSCSAYTDDVQNNSNAETSKDPKADPLFIANDDASDKDAHCAKSNQPKKKKTPRRCSMTEKNKTCNNGQLVRSSSEEDIDQLNCPGEGSDEETYQFLKHTLGLLDMTLLVNDEESEDDVPVSGNTRTVSTSESNMKKLRNLKVNLEHRVPKQHKIEHRGGTKAISRTEKELFMKLTPIKKGVFSPKEDDIIKNNWIAFCQAHDWDPKDVEPFCSMKTKDNKLYIKSKEERQKFVQYLANGLPWRTLYSIYQRFRTLYTQSYRKCQRYTPSDDETILSYIENNHWRRKNQHSFAVLGKMLGRTGHSIWSRYQILKERQAKKNQGPLLEVKWTATLISKFIKTLMCLTLCENVFELKDATIPKPVWLKMEEKLKINNNVLKLFWLRQLHLQLFCPETIYMNDIKIKLIEYIYGKGVSNSREIVWPNVAKYFEGITSVFLCRVFFHLVKDATQKLGTKDFPEIIEYLYSEKIREIQNDVTDKFLPRFSYKSGKVQVIDVNPNHDPVVN